MVMNHTESQRASGATSASPSGRKGVVMPAGSKPVCRGSSPSRPAVSAPDARTSSREATSARQATAHEAAHVPSGRTPTMVAEGAMTLLAETFFQRYDNQLTAALSLVVAFSLILFVDRLIKRRGRQVRSALALDQLDPVVDTRLRFVRRFVEAAIE